MPDDKMLKLKEYQKDYQKMCREMKKVQGNSAKKAVLNP